MLNRKRNTELLLILLVLFILALGWWQVAEIKMHLSTLEEIWPTSYWLVAYAGLFGAVHLAMRFFAKYADPLILPTAMFLNGFGLLFLYRNNLTKVENSRARYAHLLEKVRGIASDLPPAEQTELANFKQGMASNDGGKQLLYVFVSVLVLCIILHWMNSYDLRIKTQQIYKRFISTSFVQTLIRPFSPLLNMVIKRIPFLSKMDMLSIKEWWGALYWASLVFLILPTLLGKGNIRISFTIFGVSVQPSEFSKIGLLIFLTSYLSNRPTTQIVVKNKWSSAKDIPLESIGQLILAAMGPLLILAVQKDLGPTLLIYGLFCAVFYMATGRTRYLVIGTVLSAGLAFVAWRTIGIVSDRLNIWLDPWNSSFENIEQLQQSLIAIATGGLFGTGLGNGSPGRIPLSSSDFIFAPIAEELGFIGVVPFFLVYLLFINRGFTIALRSRDDFHRLVSSGISFLIGLQAFIIIGGTSGLIPLTGITLPFMSAGGSSLLASYILLAFLIGLSSKVEQTQYELAKGR